MHKIEIISEPLVTIGIPNYNNAEFILQAIDSVLNQTYQNFELLISDNCSTDNSIEVIKKSKDDRIKFWINDSNIGMYPNWTKLYKQARGKYFVLLQADDWLNNDFISKTVSNLEKHKADIAFVGFAYRGIKNKDILPSEIGVNKINQNLNTNDILEYFDQPLGSFIHATTYLIRKDLIPEGYGGTKDSFFQDIVFWAKAITFGKVIILNEILSYQRMHLAQDRKNRKDKSTSINEVNEALNILKSIQGMNTKINAFKRNFAGEYFLDMLLNINNPQIASKYYRNLKKNNQFILGLLFFPSKMLKKVYKKITK